jgi:ribose/xylose/arabinose/galactoside ABC-type transport system permease subunit
MTDKKRTKNKSNNNKNIAGIRPIYYVGKNWSLFFLIVLLFLFSVLGDNFFSVNNINNLILAVSSLLLLAAGETFVIISGGIDLSIGFVMGFACVSSAIVMRDMNAAGYAPIVSMLSGSIIGLFLGSIPGLINGFLVARLRVPPFIATLGMWGIANGLAWRLCEGFPIGFLPLQARDFGNSFLAYFSQKEGFSILVKPELTERADILSLIKIVPVTILIIAIILILFSFVLSRTRFGQHTYAIGDEVNTAIRAGINVPGHLIKIYIISSFLASCAGVLLVYKLHMGVHTQYTSSYELFAVAAVIIGGASLTGGKGSIWGTTVGVILIGTLNNGLMMMGLPIFYRYIAIGIILIVAVLIDQFFPELVYNE